MTGGCDHAVHVCPKASARKLLHRVLGYTLSGNIDHEKMFFMLGGGSNGKSVLANVMTFIKMLFNAKKTFPMPNGGNIEINYFNTIKDARNYLDGLEGVWEVLRFTPSQYNNEHHEKYGDVFSKTSHQVIGQEFDGVVVTIDEYFSYNDDGELTYGGKAYYHPVKMLFQNITRSRRRLNLVIIKNERILNRCISILQVK